MKVLRVNLTKARLAAMPPAERAALLLLGHAFNEINVLIKLILMARKQSPDIQVVDHVEAAQTFIVLRLLIGKLHEAWEMFKKRLQANKQISSQYLSALTGDAAAALEELKKHFGQGSVLTEIRNFSFHYEDKDNLMETSFQSAPNSEPWEFYLGKTNGSTCYYASELVAQAGVLGLVNLKGSPTTTTVLRLDSKSFEPLCDIVIKVSKLVAVLFRTLIESLLTSVNGCLERETVDVPDCPKISEFALPFFFDEYDELPPG
jgi:hypothetical protein